jgi:hypothetical protein
VVGSSRPVLRAGILRQGKADQHQGKIRSRPCAAPARRPGRRAKPGARSMAQRQFLGRAREPGARRVR